MTTLQIDDLNFELRLSPRRRSLEIIVDRDGELILAAPEGVAESVLRQFVDDKRYWIYQKIAEKAELQLPIPRKQFVDGEGFLYLGRSYRLKLVDQQDHPLKFIDGRFRLRRELAEQ